MRARRTREGRFGTRIRSIQVWWEGRKSRLQPRIVAHPYKRCASKSSNSHDGVTSFLNKHSTMTPLFARLCRRLPGDTTWKDEVCPSSLVLREQPDQPNLCGTPLDPELLLGL